jgi:hypothetical protein
MSYQEGSSWTAYEAVDSCYVGGFHNAAIPDDGGTDDLDPGHASAFAFPLMFGCQTRVSYSWCCIVLIKFCHGVTMTMPKYNCYCFGGLRIGCWVSIVWRIGA